MLGYAIDATPGPEIVDEIMDLLARSGEQKWLACINPHSYVVSLHDERFASALRAADWLIPDGIGIVLASKALGGKIRERFSGPDLFPALTRRLSAAHSDARVFFLGGSEETLDGIRRRMKRENPGVRVVGTYSPPFKPEYSDEDSAAMAAAVNATNADVLWVGLTAPKQEKWIFANRHRLDAKFIGAIGAVFDLYAGTIKDTPPKLQKHGLQWLSRLLREPRRLWRRTFVSAPIFVWHVLREKMRKGTVSVDHPLAHK